MGTRQSRIYNLLKRYGPMSKQAIHDVFGDDGAAKRNITWNSIKSLVREELIFFDGFRYTLQRTSAYEKPGSKLHYTWLPRE